MATFQLTDDVATIKPEERTSMKIARAKGIMHLADNILMFMPLRSGMKADYEIVSYDCLDNDGEVAEVKSKSMRCRPTLT